MYSTTFREVDLQERTRRGKIGWFVALGVIVAIVCAIAVRTFFFGTECIAVVTDSEAVYTIAKANYPEGFGVTTVIDGANRMEVYKDRGFTTAGTVKLYAGDRLCGVFTRDDVTIIAR